VHNLKKSKPVDGRWDFEGVTSLWISSDSLYAYTAGYLYIQALYDTSHYRYINTTEVDEPDGYKVCMAGTGDNDVFMAGHFLTVVHYNGKSLRSYPELSRKFAGGVFNAIALTKDRVYLAGYTDRTMAIIAVGKRVDKTKGAEGR
jgi:hypothetical protein